MATDQWLGRELLGYRLENLIGRGGMGVVYRADDLRLKRSVALKLVAPELSQDERFRTRFLAETELVTSLEHPNVVPIYDAGDADGQLYLAMRCVEGSDLKTLLAREGRLDPTRAVAIAAQVAAALDAAHEHGLVHRDVKPSNVLLDAREHVYLTDFGLARRLGELGPAVAAEVSLGTPAYASPEQIAGGEVDGRADVYALGCLLYECLAGSVPYPRSSELAVLWAHLNEAPEAISAYPQLEPVVSTALAKDRDDRYQSCGELVEAARDALALREVVVVRDRRPLLLLALGALVAVGAVAAGLVLSLTGGGPARASTTPTLTPRVDSLQRIDPETNTLKATIGGVGRDPDAVAAGSGWVWVGSVPDQSVFRIDPKTNEVTNTITTDGPNSIAVAPGNVYVANTDASLTHIQLDASSLKISTDSNRAERSVAVGEGGIWIAGQQGLVHVNREGFVVRRRAGFSPSAVVTGGGAVWVLDYKLRSLWRVDPRTDRVVKRIRLGFDPAGLAFGRGRVWVTDNGGDAVAEIDPATNRVVRSIPVGDGPIGVAVGEGFVWTANYGAGTVSRIDPRRGTGTAIPVGRHPTGVAVGEGGVWVTVRAR